ncbi:right-handed parallel beta-helix repeat-containing protein [Larkinella sp. GY13]|uniref:right-handed parallel beta-helix repeat-containing protein n=1 Tax=Larkinella sp. GY13 TaxID=3453720 RepID=UPI003EEE11A5
MKKNLLILFLSLLGFPALAQLKLYVTETGAGNGDGTSWANAYNQTQLQLAIDEGYQSGSAEVWVAQGTYKPPYNPSFYLSDGVTIYGGFPAGGGTMAQRNPTLHATVLSGEAGVDGDPADNLTHVIFTMNASNTAVLDGFVITGGNAPVGNPAGGGILNDGGSPTIRNCRFIGNRAVIGAAIANYNGSPTLINCTFIDNVSSNGGGAILNYASDSQYAFPTITNCTFYNNSASHGRVLYTYGAAGRSNPTLTNCILWNNGGATSIGSEAGNTVTIRYSALEDGTTYYTDAGNNITNHDPLFVDPAGNDLRLSPCSPLLNTGLASANTTEKDLAGQNRIQQNAIDLGAFEIAAMTAPNLSYNGQTNTTVAQNTPNIVLTAPNCSGELAWVRTNPLASGTGSITVPTDVLATYVYTALCKVGTCVSLPASATVTIVPPGQEPEPPVVSGNFDGYLDKVECGSFRGWAWDKNQPNTPITLEFFADAQSIGTISANLFRQDLKDAGKGNGQHAYSFTTPQSLKDGQNHVISAKVQNSNYTLKWAPKMLNCSNGNPNPDPPVVDPPVGSGNYEGYLDKVECSSFRGWAWDASQPNTPVSVEFFADGQSLGSIVADLFRQDIKDAGKGNGKHVYHFTTPESIRDAQPHLITAKVLNSNYTLKWAPKTLTCPSATRRAVESAENGTTWKVTVLGNPVTGQAFDTEIQNAEGQHLRFHLTDLNGRTITETWLEVDQAIQQNRLPFLNQPAGMYLLRVAGSHQVQTIKILKR